MNWILGFCLGCLFIIFVNFYKNKLNSSKKSKILKPKCDHDWIGNYWINDDSKPEFGIGCKFCGIKYFDKINDDI